MDRPIPNTNPTTPLSLITIPNSRRLIVVILLFLCSALCIFILIQNDQSINRYYDGKSLIESIALKSKNQECPKSIAMWKLWSSQIRSCLLSKIKIDQSIWRTLHRHVGVCLGEAGWRMLDPKILRNRDDVKFAILPIDNRSIDLSKNRHIDISEDRFIVKSIIDQPKIDNCTVITLGIGNDVESELKLKALLPQCRFVGADPSYDNGIIYSKKLGGKFIQTAVTDRQGFYRANILDKDGRYRVHDGVLSTSLIDFVIDNVESKIIDYLFMDNEGAEYQLLKQFLDGDRLQKEGIVVCQLSVELHGPLRQYQMNETGFNRLIEDLVEKSPMLPVWSAEPINHMRSFYINVEHPYCVEKYFLL